ncbi:MAG: amino acid carrier protein, partial [Thermoanaerobaculales bacterium]|nr:amino acid carrier protein [Thermoanaerobaculales bacterium]
METFNNWMVAFNDVLWANWVLYIVLATGVLFTIWSRFGQATALTHGWTVIRGQYDDPADPGAINHFQALSAALSATVGLGNIGGVALAIALGGPGAVFWMWVVGSVGMALKMTEVTLAMLYRNTDDPDNPHGGPMWVAKQGISRLYPKLGWLGSLVGGIFCITLLISTITGGNMFQAWNVGEITQSYFGIPSVFTGIVLAIVVGLVIIGGIKRIGNVAGHLVPVMMALYIIGGLYVLALNVGQLPRMFLLILEGAFSSSEASGAFIGGTAGYAFLFGMKRALFSNEAGQGSSPIAHSAAKTDEPVREGIVAGLEPFIDTIIVCTLPALVILSTGIWNRGPDATYAVLPEVVQVSDGVWTLETRAYLGGMEGLKRWRFADVYFSELEGTVDVLVLWGPARRGRWQRVTDKIVRCQRGSVQATFKLSPND